MSSHEAPRPDECLSPTWFIDSDHPDVCDFATNVVTDAGATNDRERAVALFDAVRDGWRYDPYNPSLDPDAFKATSVLETSANWCVPKSILLTASCRSLGIPAALGFADVRNHLQSEKLRRSMGTDLVAYHGYSTIWLGSRWRKAASAFNRELCERFGTKLVEFNGVDDALAYPVDASTDHPLEYVSDRGVHADVPLDDMRTTFHEVYGHDELGTANTVNGDAPS